MRPARAECEAPMCDEAPVLRVVVLWPGGGSRVPAEPAQSQMCFSHAHTYVARAMINAGTHPLVVTVQQVIV